MCSSGCHWLLTPVASPSTTPGPQGLTRRRSCILSASVLYPGDTLGGHWSVQALVHSWTWAPSGPYPEGLMAES